MKYAYTSSVTDYEILRNKSNEKSDEFIRSVGTEYQACVQASLNYKKSEYKNKFTPNLITLAFLMGLVVITPELAKLLSLKWTKTGALVSLFICAIGSLGLLISITAHTQEMVDGSVNLWIAGIYSGIIEFIFAIAAAVSGLATKKRPVQKGGQMVTEKPSYKWWQTMIITAIGGIAGFAIANFIGWFLSLSATLALDQMNINNAMILFELGLFLSRGVISFFFGPIQKMMAGVKAMD